MQAGVSLWHAAANAICAPSGDQATAEMRRIARMPVEVAAVAAHQVETVRAGKREHGAVGRPGRRVGLAASEPAGTGPVSCDASVPSLAITKMPSRLAAIEEPSGDQLGSEPPLPAAQRKRMRAVRPDDEDAEDVGGRVLAVGDARAVG